MVRPPRVQGYDTYIHLPQIKLVAERISPIQRLSVYYRATAPGHPGCELSEIPYKDGPEADHIEHDVTGRLQAQVDTLNLKKERARWDWSLFAVHNKMWKWNIQKLDRERGWRELQGNNAGAKWFYMDLWSQALQRPDAHSEPGHDCLHCEFAVSFLWSDVRVLMLSRVFAVVA
jgi:hypothetical protein